VNIVILESSLGMLGNLGLELSMFTQFKQKPICNIFCFFVFIGYLNIWSIWTWLHSIFIQNPLNSKIQSWTWTQCLSRIGPIWQFKKPNLKSPIGKAHMLPIYPTETTDFSDFFKNITKRNKVG
jgi:hypothetical protein